MLNSEYSEFSLPLSLMRALFFLGLIVLSAPIVWAQNAAVEVLPPFLQSRVVDSDPLMDFRTQSVPQGRVDRDTGVLRAAYRLAPTVLLRATHEATARAYLDAEAERFGWATADDLLLVREIDGHYSAHLTFQQMFGGIPVHNRFVKVSMGPSGHPSMVLSGYAPHLRDAGPVRLQPLMDASGAVLRAQQEMRAQGVSTPELVVYPSVPPRLAWRMTTSPDGSVAEWEVLMDADTGEILYLMNQVMHMDTPSSVPASPVPLASASSAPAEPASVPVARAVVDGTGLVFDPDPLTSAGVPHGGAYMDYGDADVEELNAERKEVVLRDITLGADGLYRLIGPYVEITGEPSPYGTAWTPPAEADPDSFRYGRANDSFEAVMMYYHIDQNQRYIQSLDVGYPIGEYSIRVNPHGEGNTSRAVYYTRSRSLSFGDNGIDHAEDVDVILVVYGFALIDDIVSGLYYSSWEGEAVVRGWSLYWAASYSRWLAETGEVPAFQDWWRLLNWKSPGFGWPLDAPVGLRYPENTGCDDGAPCDPTGDGLLWATTMMEIYDELGKTVTDRLHLASFAYLSSPSTFFDAAEALLQADETLYSGQYRNILTERLAARGYLRVPLRLSVSPSTVAEEDAAVEVRVTATLDDGWMFPSAQPVTVNVGVPGDSAEEGTDYAAVSDFTITIPSESSSATGTFMLNPTSDDIFEGSEIVSVEGSMTIAEPYGSEITITDDDVRSTALLLTINPKSVRENDGTVRLRVTASLNAGTSTAPIAVTVSVTDGTADLGDDYRVRSNPSPLIIPAGKKSVTRTVELSVLEDDIEEDNETIVIGVSATGLTPASQDVTITANDASLSVTLGVSPPRVAENVGTAEVTVTATVDGGRTFAGVQTVTVSVGAQGDSAEEGTDYVAVSDFAITIPGGSSSATSSFTLDPVDNVIFEGDKTVGVSGALSRRTVAPTELTITDDDAASTALVLTISPESVEEDAGVISLGITASLDAGASTEIISVAVSVMDGTAGPSDYTTVSIPSPLKIPAGALEVTGTVELSILEDDVEEGEETVVIGASATGLTADSQEFTITDNDVLLPVTLGVSPPRVVENVETAEVTVTATVDGGTFAELMAVTISVGTLGDSAVEGTDYAVVEAFTITIPAGSASATSTFTLDPLDDNIAEGDETVSVEGTLSGRTVTPAQVTITDDDVPSTALALTLNPARLHEDSGTSWVRFTADLNDAARPMDTPVDVSVSGGTATADADYSTPVIPTSIMIPAGETSISDSLQITVTDDDEVEGNETIVIGVSAPDLTGTMQDLVIIDNETAVRIDVLNVIAKDDGDYTIGNYIRKF